MPVSLESLVYTQLFSVVMVSENEFSHPNMAFALCFSLSTLFLSFLCFVFRFFHGGDSLKNPTSLSQENSLIDDSSLPPEERDRGTQILGSFDSDEKEEKEFEFKFRFQTYEEFSSVALNSNTASSSSSRYEFLPEKSTSHFMEEFEIPSFTVEELNSHPNGDFLNNHEILGNGKSSIEELAEKISESEPLEDEIPEIFSKSESKDEKDITEKQEGEISDFRKSENFQTNSRENELLTEKDFVADFDTNSTTSSFECSITSQLDDRSSVGFLTETDFEDETPLGIDGRVETDLDSEELYSIDLNIGYEPEDFEDEDGEINEELKTIDDRNPEKLPEFHGKSVEEEDSSFWESEESNGLESQWEHQELIEQLKMELKKVRATGLPTIFEESESPKIMADLKPWKIDEKYQHGDVMDELHKFYKTYRERMRKFDILNYQKMYAIGFLQSKDDPLKSFSSSSKPSSPSLTSLLSHNLKVNRQKKSQVDPMQNFIRELHCDLEMVYVGQMCLSWEFIQWQYGKALDLWDSQPYGLHQYNEVAGEFQQFQVLLQRFIENETFQGPRVENYVRNRCVARNLLQVPVIREDKRRDTRKAGRGKDKNEATTSDMLVEILQESIRVIWQFIRADKDHNIAGLKRPKKLQIQLQDPADTPLLMEIQADLQKKERKLKDIVRSGHCILKKLQKNEEEEEVESDVHFFSQVDMKLVSRVLKMSRITTDQLVWCRNKLSRINFINRKIHVEPSFFLFPCS